MKTRIFIFFTLVFNTLFYYSQSTGITYQALIINPKGENVPGVNNLSAPLVNKEICMRFSIYDSNNLAEYVETIKTTTDKAGIVNLIIGTGNKTGGYASSFSGIVWDKNLKRLKVEFDENANCSNYLEISNQTFSYVPFSYYSSSTKEATATTTGSIQLAGDLAGVGSTAKSPKITDGAITTNKLANGAVVNSKIGEVISVINGGTGASNIVGYVVGNGQNAMTGVTSIPVSDVNGAQTIANLETNVATSSSPTTKYPSVKALKDYVDNSVSGATIPDASTTIKGKIQLAGDLTGTAASPAIATGAVTTGKLADNAVTTAKIKDGEVTDAKIANGISASKVGLGNVDNTSDANKPVSTAQQAALDLKENLSNKSTDITADGASNTKYPAVKAIKDYVDTAITSATIPDADATTKGKLQLAGDLTGTAASPAIAAGAVTTVKLADDAVTTAKIKDGNVTTGKINDAAIITSKIDDDAVTTAKIKDGNITTGKINDAAIITSKIDDDAVTTVKLADASVTNAKLAEPVSIANGGTGSSTQNFVDLTTAQTIAGVKTFNSDIIANGVKVGKGAGNGDSNVAVGTDLGSGTGYRNTGVGAGALQNFSGTSFGNNTGIGYANMQGLTTGYGNTSLGGETLASVANNDNNTAIGNQTLRNAASSNNTALGANAGNAVTTGSGNTLLGSQADIGTGTNSNATAIGYGAVVNGDNTIQLGNTSITSVKTSGKLTTGTVTYPNTNGTSGQFLKTDGNGNAVWTSLPSVNSDLSSGFSGILPIANGGTGSSSKNFVDLTTDQTVAGNKEFSSDINVNGITIGRGEGNNELNTVIGNGALGSGSGTRNNTSGSTAIGAYALVNTTGINNTGVGLGAGYTITTGQNNTFLGQGANAASYNTNNSTAIGYGAVVNGDNTIQLGNGDITSVKTSGKLTTGTVTYPNTNGTSGQFLKTDGSGNASWSDPAINTNDIVDGAVTDDKIASGINKSKVGLDQVDNTSDADKQVSTSQQAALDLKENLSNKSTDVSADGSSDEKYPSVKSIKDYVDSSIASATIADADANTKGKLQLAGDLTGTAASPAIATGAVTSAKIKDGDIVVGDLADDAVETAKIKDANVTTAKLADASVTNAKLAEPVSIANGGTGSSSKNFVDLTTDQTIAGAKTLSANATIGGARFGTVHDGDNNLFIGKNAFTSGTSAADYNLAIGENALKSNTDGYSNVAIGLDAMKSNLTGYHNVGVGRSTLQNLTTGWSNVALGQYAGSAITSGTDNVGLGWNAVSSVTTGTSNVGIGTVALKNTTGSSNVGIGHGAGVYMTTGQKNTLIGQGAGANLSSGSNNIILGYLAAESGLNTGSYNTIIGSNIATPSDVSNYIMIGDGQGNVRAQHNGTSWTLGNIGSGVWNGSTISIAYGGTGATTAAAARTNLGLGNVENTADADKPVSTLQQAALNLKENLSNKSTDITADAASNTKYPSVKAIKDYVDALNAAAGVADGSITSAKIADGTIVNADVASNAAIAYSKLNLSGSIVTADIADGAVTTAKLADASVTTAKVNDGAITTAKLASNAVTTAKLTDANVTYAKIQNVSATDKVLGRVSAGAGTIEEISTTGSGNVVRATSPTLVTPNLGTPSAVDLTNATNLPLSAVTGTLPVAKGGTGLTSLTAGYIPFGNGTNAFGNSANLFWDNTNSRLGINTSTPSATFQIGTDCSSCADNLKYFVENNFNTLKLGFRSSGWHMRTSNDSGVATDLRFSYNNGTTLTDQLIVSTLGTVSVPGSLEVTDVSAARLGKFRDLNLNENTINYSADQNRLGIFCYPSAPFQIYGDGNFEYPLKYTSDGMVGGTLGFGFRNKQFLIHTTSDSGVLNNMIYSYDDGNSNNTEIMRLTNDGKLNISGGLQIPSNASTGKVLTSDANGNASWANIPSLADGAVTSAKIADGTIANADIATTAAIAYSKLNLTGSIATADITDAAVTTAKVNDGAVTSAKIADGTIANADVSTSAAIAFSKLNITKSDIVGLGIPGSDSDTTYTAGTGVTLTGTTFSIGQDVATTASPTFAKVNKVTITAPTTGSTLTIADGKTLTANNSIILAGTDGKTMTFPSTDATIARTDAAQTFTGTQTFSSTITGSISGNAATATKATNIAGGAAGSIPYQTAADTTSLLAKGTDGQVLTLVSGVPAWSNSGGTASVLSKSASYTITATDNAKYVVFSGSTASQTITLPSAVTVGAGREITIKNVASVSLTINATAGYLISDSTTTTASSLAIGIEPSNNWIKAISDGTNWIILRALF